MYGHQCNTVVIILVILVGLEHNVLHPLVDGWLIANLTKAIVHIVVALILVGAHHREKLVEVVLRGVGLGALLGLEKVHNTRARDNLLGEIANAHLHTHCCKLRDEFHEIGNLAHHNTLDVVELGIVAELRNSVPHRYLLLCGELLNTRYGCIADAACWIVDNTLERLVVVGVYDEGNVCQEVADILMLEQGHTLVYAVGDATSCECRLEETVLLVSAVQDSKVAPRSTIAVLILDVHSHLNSLVVVLHNSHKAYLVAHLGSREALLLQTARVVLDERVGSLNDGLCRAIVLLELIDLGRRIVPLEREDILDLRTTEGVDTLRIVTHNAYVGVEQRQTAHDDILRHIRILILIDKHIAELLLILCQHLGHVAQQDVGLQEQVVEVHSTVELTAAAVFSIYVARLGNLKLAILGRECRIGDICARRNQAVLRHRDTRSDSLRLVLLLREVHILDNRLHQILGIVRLVYRIALRKAYLLGILT